MTECRISRHTAAQPISIQDFQTQQKPRVIEGDTMPTSIPCLLMKLESEMICQPMAV